ncbi:MAG: hypothetical protein GTN70_01425 [Deltaproteobacteria bacterium]|nr:hypothetical protein [Deltaproteobacteria bacterium]NIS77731.1 hypothetical protein [Deltaproteobacteria bacterium]
MRHVRAVLITILVVALSATLVFAEPPKDPAKGEVEGISGVSSKVRIFGKDDCPFTVRALEEYEKNGYDVEYIDVTRGQSMKEEMIRISGGKLVPVIVEGEEVNIGYGGT